MHAKLGHAFYRSYTTQAQHYTLNLKVLFILGEFGDKRLPHSFIYREYQHVWPYAGGLST